MQVENSVLLYVVACTSSLIVLYYILSLAVMRHHDTSPMYLTVVPVQCSRSSEEQSCKLEPTIGTRLLLLLHSLGSREWGLQAQARHWKERRKGSGINPTSLSPSIPILIIILIHIHVLHTSTQTTTLPPSATSRTAQIIPLSPVVPNLVISNHPSLWYQSQQPSTDPEGSHQATIIARSRC